ncbi:MAG: hypothetical protein A2751_03625 [Candidatus Doudnabacteria bacterium RIFCSPHIGHO2_01_FULL_46_14]|uniref:Dockerin domain-containing protein n=1 Tax=Candidatus Doudnabacteria bacterium RIFCSPHIGHO2_01_FULL_46_14 TaxID=1817824 RepID=A0A1F5NKL4_9BACT|nr:MAG: hypothetical protein A2751_03625 [Candidatus Doudnabacteria bacterium RIFCSPHIGHO2_01_FULL_46_14]
MLNNKRFGRLLILAGVILTTGFFVSGVSEAAVSMEGSLVADNSGTVYLVTGGERRPFRSPEVFYSHGYSFSMVGQATADDLNLPIGPVMIFRDGTLVKGPNDPLVYLITTGYKRPFQTAEDFLGLGYSFFNVVTANAETFADLPVGGIMSEAKYGGNHPPGTLINDNGTIYLITPNGRSGFANADDFRSHGYGFNQVVLANETDRTLPNTGNVPYRFIPTSSLPFSPKSPPPLPSDPRAPTRPAVTGPTSVLVKSLNTYSAVSTDPDGDYIIYTFDWGDGNSSERSAVSGQQVFVSEQVWATSGIYTVKVQARDDFGHYSVVNTMTVSVLPDLPPAPTGSDLPGDANLDDKVNTGDSVVIDLHVDNVSKLTDLNALNNADVDGNGLITKNDANLVANFFGRVINKFPTSSTTVISFAKASPLSSTTVAAGANNQQVGAFAVTVIGNPVQVSKLVFAVNKAITNVVVKDGDKIIAGPFDAIGGKITMTDTIIFQPGTSDYKIYANLNNAFATGDVLTLTLENPETAVTAKDIVSLSGITAQPRYNKALESVIIRKGAVVVSTSSSPASQSVLIGTPGFTFANFVVDAAGSSEDIRITSFKVSQKTSMVGIQSDIANLTMYDGTTRISPFVQQPGGSLIVTFNFTSPVIVPRGTAKTLTLKGDVVAGKNGQTHSFGCRGTGCITVVGSSTGTAITPTVVDSDGPIMTLSDGTGAGGGTLTISADASSPPSGLLVGGASKVTVAELRFSAANDDMNLDSLHFDVTGVNGGILRNQVNQVYLFDGTSLLAFGVPTTTSAITFQNLRDRLIIPKNGSKKLTVKVDTGVVTNGQGDGYVARSGQGVAFNVYEDSYGAIGQTSGTRVLNSSKSGSVTGSEFTVYKSIPNVQRVPLNTGTLVNGTNVPVYKFKITADSKGDIAFHKAVFEISASNVSTGPSYGLFEEPGTINEVDLNYYPELPGASTDPISSKINLIKRVGTPGNFRLIAAGLSKIYEVRTTISNRSGNATVSTVMLGDSSSIFVPGQPPVLNTMTGVDSFSASNFIWSDLHRSNNPSAVPLLTQWYNGFRVPGLPSRSDAQVLTSPNVAPPPVPTPTPGPTPVPVPSYRYIKVQSSSNSWIAWHEIQAIDTSGNILTPVSCSASGNYLSSCQDVYPGRGSYWNAGDWSGWITLDYGANKFISQIKLLPSNSPNPASGTHEIFAMADGGSGYGSPIKTFSGAYYDQQWLTHQVSSSSGIGLENPGAVTVTAPAGQYTNAFSIRSTTAKSFYFYGYPTSYGAGINIAESSGGISPGTQMDIRIQVNSNVPAGTYKGTVSLRTSDSGITGEVTFPITVIVPSAGLPDFSVELPMDINPKIVDASNAIEVNKDAVLSFTIKNNGSTWPTKPSFSLSYKTGINPVNADAAIPENTCSTLTQMASNQSCVYAVKLKYSQTTSLTNNEVRLDIDYYNLITETDESNNWGITSFGVRSVPVVPKLISLSQNSGPTGTKINIEGTDIMLLGRPTTVWFGAVSASFPFGSGFILTNVEVPTSLTQGIYPVTVSNGVMTSNALNFTVTTGVPNTPSNLVADNSVCGQVTLSWTDNAANEDGFKIYRNTAAPSSDYFETGTGFSRKRYDLVWTVGNNLNTHTSGPLTDNPSPGGGYGYAVRAYNNTMGDSAWVTTSNSVLVNQCTQSPPPTPTPVPAPAPTPTPVPTPTPGPTPVPVPSYRYLKVQSTSNSWVAWHKIEAYDSGGNLLTPVSCSASDTYSTYVCQNTYPGASSYFISPGYSASITLDYGSNKSISQVKLKPSNDPNPANATHQLFGMADVDTGSGYVSLKTFSGPIYDQQWLTYDTSAVQGASIGNRAPSAPTITKTGQVIYGYSVDLDGDAITYRVNWGDGSAEETQRLGSGYAYVLSHGWRTGTYLVTVAADDGRGSSASVSFMLVSVP